MIYAPIDSKRVVQSIGATMMIVLMMLVPGAEISAEEVDAAAIKEWREGPERGDSQYQFNLGWMPYKGDGEYETQGLLLRSRRLTLPTFQLADGAVLEYELDGVMGGWRHMVLLLESDAPIPFWRLRASLSVQIIEEGTGEVVLEMNSRLNSHYERMEKVGTALWKKDGEWSGRYRYADSQLELKAVSFTKGVDPLETLEMKYITAGPSMKWWRKYKIKIRVLDPDAEFEGLRGRVMLISTWK